MELEIKNISPQKLKSFMLSSNGTVNFLFNGEKAGKGKYENGNLEMDFYTMPKFLEEKKFTIEGKQILAIPELIDKEIKEITILGKDYNTTAKMDNERLSIENNCDKLFGHRYDTRPMTSFFCNICNKIKIPENIKTFHLKNMENGNLIEGNFKVEKKIKNIENFSLKSTYGTFDFENNAINETGQGLEPANALILSQNFNGKDSQEFSNEIKKIVEKYKNNYFTETENEIFIEVPEDDYIFQFSKALSVYEELADKKLVIKNPVFVTSVIDYLPDNTKLFDKEGNCYSYDRKNDEVRQTLKERGSLQEFVEKFIIFERNRDIEDDRKFITSCFGNAIEKGEDFEGLKITTFAMNSEKFEQFRNLEVSKNIQQIRIEDMYKRQFIKFSDELSKEKIKELKEEILEDKKMQKYGGEFLYKGKRTFIMPEEERDIKKENQKTR